MKKLIFIFFLYTNLSHAVINQGTGTYTNVCSNYDNDYNDVFQVEIVIDTTQKLFKVNKLIYKNGFEELSDNSIDYLMPITGFNNKRIKASNGETTYLRLFLYNFSKNTFQDWTATDQKTYDCSQFEKSSKDIREFESSLSISTYSDTNSDPIDVAKSECEDLGYTKGTEKFADCVLQLSK